MRELAPVSSKHKYFNNKFFARWAPYYDLFEIILGPLRTEAVKTLSLSKGAKILDVAAGTGSTSIALAKRGYDVTGVDLSPDMLRQAQVKVHHGLLVTFRNFDATELPFRDHSFDAGSITFGLHDMPPSIEQKVLSEMKRTIKKGGPILIIDHLEPVRHWLIRMVHPIIRKFETPNYIPFITTGLKGILQQAGLRVAQSRTWGGLFQVTTTYNR